MVSFSSVSPPWLVVEIFASMLDYFSTSPFWIFRGLNEFLFQVTSSLRDDLAKKLYLRVTQVESVPLLGGVTIYSFPTSYLSLPLEAKFKENPI